MDEFVDGRYLFCFFVGLSNASNIRERVIQGYVDIKTTFSSFSLMPFVKIVFERDKRIVGGTARQQRQFLFARREMPSTVVASTDSHGKFDGKSIHVYLRIGKDVPFLWGRERAKALAKK